MLFGLSFALYTLFIVAVGLAATRRAKRTDEDYFLAGRSLGPWVAALSASASSESGWVTLGLVGMAFANGFSAYWILPGCLLGFVFNWFVLAGPLRRQSSANGALTIPDFLARRFDERLPILRIMTVIVILVAMWLYVAAQFAAAGEAFSSAFPQISRTTGILIGTTIVLAYTVLGGFRAACWTDFVQGLVMLGALAVFPIFLVAKAGGFDAMQGALAAVDPELARFWPRHAGMALIGFLLGSGALGVNFGFPGQPHVLVRFMALRSDRDARIAGFIAVGWGTLIFFGAVTTGLAVRALTEQQILWTVPLSEALTAGAPGAGETALVLAAKHAIHGILGGVVLAAVLAAICSTADSQLVVAASAVASDIYARVIRKSDLQTHQTVNRVVLFALGLAAMAVALPREVSIYKFVLSYGWAILGAGIGPQIILAVLWKRATYAGCIAGMLTGFALALAWPQIDPLLFQETGLSLYNLVAAFMGALVVNVVVSLFAGGSNAAKTAANATA